MGFKRKNIILKVINWVFREEKTLRPEGFSISRTEVAPHRDNEDDHTPPAGCGRLGIGMPQIIEKRRFFYL
jgi:hypothetical protein